MKLAEERRFQHKDGKPKPTTIRNELLNNPDYEEIVGAIKERSLYNRVTKALKKRDAGKMQ